MSTKEKDKNVGDKPMKRFRDMTKEEKKAIRLAQRKNKRKQKKKPLVREKRKVQVVDTSLKVVGDPNSTVTSQSILNIVATAQIPALQGMWLGVWGKMFTMDWTNETTVPVGFGLDYIYDAYVIMQQMTALSMQGDTLTVSQLPYWVQVVLNILRPTVVPFKVSKLKYSWTSGFNPAIVSPQPVLVAGKQFNWVFGSPDPLQPGYNQPMIMSSYNPSNTVDANLIAAFGLIQNLNEDTRLIDYGTIKAGASDPSGFARSFSYYGGGIGQSSATFGSCELETTYIRSWMASQFVTYIPEDTRVSRSLRIKSMDSNGLCYLPLIPGLRMKDYKDPGPVVIKFLDFNEIYAAAIQFYIQAYTAWTTVQSSQSGPLAAPFPFSVQSFRIVLRQAVLNVLSDQSGFQFMYPKVQNGTGDNIFVPFFVSANTYPSAEFGKMKLPQMLAENLRALRTRVLAIGQRKTKLVHTIVLGNWILDDYDDQPQLADDLEYANSAGNLIFSSMAENSISLVDGSNLTSVGQYVNLNSQYYVSVMQLWNTAIEQFGSPVTVVLGNGPGLSLLGMTRYVFTDNDQTLTIPDMKRQKKTYPLLQEHYEAMMMKKKKSEKLLIDKEKIKEKEKVKKKELDNPPGSVYTNYTSAISCVYQMTAQAQTVCNYLILPTIRPDPLDNAYPQTQTGWQIAYFEPHQATYGTVSAKGSSRWEDINSTAAAEVILPQADKLKDDFANTWSILTDLGKGVNWMSILEGIVQTGVQVVTELI